LLLLLLLLSALLYSGEEGRSLDYLNALRQKSGLIPLQGNRLLNLAAASHANYLVLHQQIGHLEQHGHRGYTGKTPADRVVYHGYASKDVMENIAVNAKNGASAVDDLLSAIYHRFVFLSFDKDQIGAGRAETDIRKRTQNAYVYKLGSSKLNLLCQKAFIPVSGVRYLQNGCKSSGLLLPQTLYEKKQQEIKSKNAEVVLHPYPGQQGVMPAFYNEVPDPLPDYDVSGYPVSVQFNDLYYTGIKLRSFRLFDEENKEIPMSRILTHANDPHQRLKKMQFALMPIKRLEYATTYRVVFEAEVDGEPYQKSWKFTTRSFKEKLYRIEKEETMLRAEPGSTVILYFVPRSGSDLLRRYRASKGLKVTLIDQNTLKVSIPQQLRSEANIMSGGRTVRFK
ncbi:MAG: CAP domain-containing protein, partial [Campylobacterales bacterium]|nr:CAP domain-containing protein [Campylobacterales bacterium]